MYGTCEIVIARQAISITAPAECAALLRSRYAAFWATAFEAGTLPAAAYPIQVLFEETADKFLPAGEQDPRPTLAVETSRPALGNEGPGSALPLRLVAPGVVGELGAAGGTLWLGPPVVQVSPERLVTWAPGPLGANTPAIQQIDYFLRAAVAWLAYAAGGLLLHAAGLIPATKLPPAALLPRDEETAPEALLFIGPSGAGKTTVTRLSAWFALSDDLVVLLPETRPASDSGVAASAEQGLLRQAVPPNDIHREPVPSQPVSPRQQSSGWDAYATPFWSSPWSELPNAASLASQSSSHPVTELPGYPVAPLPNPPVAGSPIPPLISSPFPVRRILRLEKDTQDWIEPLPSPAQAAAELLACVPLLPTHPTLASGVFARCLALAQAVPVARLHFRKARGFLNLLC